MRIIIPMAGIGKRLRPHTLFTPKPLLPIAGKPIVERLVDEIMQESSAAVEEIVFIVGQFGQDVDERLLKLASDKGAVGRICYQPEALGTAHALSFASEYLNGEIVIAFADTLFKTEVRIDHSKDGIIWTKEVDDPRQFGVVELDAEGRITSFVEKPEEPKSSRAIIGIYYIREAERLREEIDYVIANDIRDKGEYQLTTCLDNMRRKGSTLYTADVNLWLDCGNKDNTLDTNRQILELMKADKDLISATARVENSRISPPCFIGEGARVKNSEIGPHVSIGAATAITDCVITNSMIQEHTIITGKMLRNSMIGSHVTLLSKTREQAVRELSIGDFSSDIPFQA